MGNTNLKSENTKFETTDEIMQEKIETAAINKDQTMLNFRFLTNVHEEIINHFKNDVILENSQIQIYLNVISKMKLNRNHEKLAKILQKSLQKVYNENVKPKTEITESLTSSRNFDKTEIWESTTSEKTSMVKMPYNPSNDNECFNSYMLSGKNFIQCSSSPKNVPILENNYNKNNYESGMKAAHLNNDVIIHANQIQNAMKIGITQGDHPIKSVDMWSSKTNNINRISPNNIENSSLDSSCVMTYNYTSSTSESIPKKTYQHFPVIIDESYPNFFSDYSSDEVKQNDNKSTPSIIKQSFNLSLVTSNDRTSTRGQKKNMQKEGYKYFSRIIDESYSHSSSDYNGVIQNRENENVIKPDPEKNSQQTILNTNAILVDCGQKTDASNTLTIKSSQNVNGILADSSLSTKTNDSDIIADSQKELVSKTSNSRKTTQNNDIKNVVKKLSGNKREQNLIMHRENVEKVLQNDTRNINQENKPYFLRKFSVTNSNKTNNKNSCKSCSNTTIDTNIIENSQRSLSKPKHNNTTIIPMKSYHKNRLKTFGGRNNTNDRINKKIQNKSIDIFKKKRGRQLTISTVLYNILTEIKKYYNLEKCLNNIQILRHLKEISKINIKNQNDKTMADQLKTYLSEIYKTNKSVEQSKGSETLQKVENEKSPEKLLCKCGKRTDENKIYTKEFDIYKNWNIENIDNNLNAEESEKDNDLMNGIRYEEIGNRSSLYSQEKSFSPDSKNQDQNFPKRRKNYFQRNKKLSNNQFLNQIEDKIIKHCENDEFLETDEIEYYLNTISKMNLKKDDLKFRVEKIKASLENISCYNLAFKISEEWKSVSETTNSLENLSQNTLPHVMLTPTVEQNPINLTSRNKHSDFINTSNSNETSKFDLSITKEKLTCNFNTQKDESWSSNMFFVNSITQSSIPHSKLKITVEGNHLSTVKERKMELEHQLREQTKDEDTTNHLINVSNKQNLGTINSEKKAFSNSSFKKKTSTTNDLHNRNFKQKSLRDHILKSPTQREPLIQYNKRDFDLIYEERLESFPKAQNSKVITSKRMCILKQMEEKIIRHCENEEFLENKEIRNYLKTLSEMNMTRGNLKFRAEKVQASLKKISSYNLAFNKTEEWKSVTESTDTLQNNTTTPTIEQNLLNLTDGNKLTSNTEQVETKHFMNSVNFSETPKFELPIMYDMAHCNVNTQNEENCTSNVFSCKNVLQSSIPCNELKINTERSFLSKEKEMTLKSEPKIGGQAKQDYSRNFLINVHNKQHLDVTNSQTTTQKAFVNRCNKNDFPMTNFIQRVPADTTPISATEEGPLFIYNNNNFDCVCKEKCENIQNQTKKLHKAQNSKITNPEQKIIYNETGGELPRHCKIDGFSENKNTENCGKRYFLHDEKHNLESNLILRKTNEELFRKLIKRSEQLYEDLSTVMREEFEKCAVDIGNGSITYSYVHEHLKTIEAKMAKDINYLCELFKTVTFEDDIKPDIAMKAEEETHFDKDEKIKQFFSIIIQKYKRRELKEDILKQKVKDEINKPNKNFSVCNNTKNTDVRSQISDSLKSKLNFKIPEGFCSIASSIKENSLENEMSSPAHSVYNQNLHRNRTRDEILTIGFRKFSNSVVTKLDIDIPDSLCDSTASVNENEIFITLRNDSPENLNRNSSKEEILSTSSGMDQHFKPIFPIQKDHIQELCGRRNSSNDGNVTKKDATSLFGNCPDNKLDIEIPDSFCSTTSIVKEHSNDGTNSKDSFTSQRSNSSNTNLNVEISDSFCNSTSSIKESSVKNGIVTSMGNGFNEMFDKKSSIEEKLSDSSHVDENFQQFFDIQKAQLQEFYKTTHSSKDDNNINTNINSEFRNYPDCKLDINIHDSFCNTICSIEENSPKTEIMGNNFKTMCGNQENQYQEHCERRHFMEETKSPLFESYSNKIIKNVMSSRKYKTEDAQDQLVNSKRLADEEVNRKETKPRYEEIHDQLTSLIQEVDKVAEDLEKSFSHSGKNEEDFSKDEGDLIEFLKTMSFENDINLEGIRDAMPELLKLTNIYKQKYSEKNILEMFSPQLRELSVYFTVHYSKQNDVQLCEDFLPDKTETLLKIWKDIV